MKKILWLFCILITFNSSGQNFHWAKSLCGQPYYESITGSCISQNGDIYLTGIFGGIVDFDPGPEVYNNSNNMAGAFVLALDSYGNFKWVTIFRGDVQPSSIVMDNSGNILVSGLYNNMAQFDPDYNNYYFTSTVSNAFVVKLNASGTVLWAKRDGYGSQTSWSSEIVTDEQNNIYTLGTFQGNLTLPTGTTIVSNGFYNTYLEKRDSSGNFLWLKSFGGPGLMSSLHLKRSVNNELYITGSFSNTVDFDPGSGLLNQTSNGYRDIYVMKVDTSGSFIWAKTFGSVSEDSKCEISIDNQSNVYLAFNADASLDIDPSPTSTILIPNQGGTDICILKLNSSGNYIWSKSIASASGEYVNSMTVNKQQEINLVGDFYGSLDFDPGPSVFNAASGQVFLEKLDSNGNFIWVKTIDAPGFVNFVNVCTGEANAIVVTGTFNSKVDFDPGQSVTYLTSCYTEDMFVLKFGDGYVSVPEHEKQVKFQIYPNPGDGYFTLELEQFTDNYSLEIKDITGIILESKEIKYAHTPINLKNYSSGVYFVTIKYEGRTETVKIIKCN